MREIKFRAFQKYQNKMFEVYQIDFRYELILAYCPINESDHTFGFNSCELMQCTGLKDKNGQEIYGSDICKVINSKGVKFIAVAVFVDGCWELHSKTSNLCGLNPYRDYLKCYTCNHEIEVIGNIHENLELLEAENERA